MNNQTIKFHLENSSIINQLVESLDAIIKKFDEGIIPGEPEKSDAIYMLNTYLNLLNRFDEVIAPAFVKISNKEADTQKFDENVAQKELMALRDSIRILLRLGREKLIIVNDPAFESAGGKALIGGGYCEEIMVNTGENHYYVLSEKGENAVRNKGLLAALRKDYCTAIIPQGILNESFKWSNLYVRRVEMINKYFRIKRDNAEHIVFSLDESRDMVFGCEINDTEDVTYVFSGIFDEKINDHVFQLKSIADSGRIDHLIVLNSSEEGRAMIEKAGLICKDYPSIEYELLK